MLEQIQISAWKCKCDGCRHEWVSTKDSPPTHCPNRACKNPTKWNAGGTKRKKSKPIIKMPPMSEGQTHWKIQGVGLVDEHGELVEDTFTEPEREIIPIPET